MLTLTFLQMYSGRGSVRCRRDMICSTCSSCGRMSLCHDIAGLFLPFLFISKNFSSGLPSLHSIQSWLVNLTPAVMPSATLSNSGCLQCTRDLPAFLDRFTASLSSRGRSFPAKLLYSTLAHHFSRLSLLITGRPLSSFFSLQTDTQDGNTAFSKDFGAFADMVFF